MEFTKPSTEVPRLPPEMWRVVLGKLACPKDILTCMKTCKGWEAELSAKVVTWLLPTILRYAGRHLERKEIMRWRSVCLDWKEIIDKDLEQKIAFTSDINFRRRYFSHGDHIFRFLSDMRDHTGNPFPDRTICFIPNGIGDKRLYQGFSLLAEKFGEHVYHLFYRVQADNPESVAQTRNIFHRLPNIHSLTIVSEFDDWDIILEMREMRWIREELFRPLKNLTCLRVSGRNSHIFRLILLKIYGHQLEHLDGSWEGDCCLDLNPDIVQPEELPNIKELRVVAHNGSTHLFDCIVSRDWQLRKFSATVLTRDIDVDFLKRLFELVNKFSNTLTMLYLVENGEGQINLRLRNAFSDDDRRGICPVMDVICMPISLIDTQFFKVMMKKCIKLRYLMILDQRPRTPDMAKYHAAKDERYVHRLWDQIPSTVREISLLCVGNNEYQYGFRCSREMFEWGKPSQNFKSRVATFFQSFQYIRTCSGCPDHV